MKVRINKTWIKIKGDPIFNTFNLLPVIAYHHERNWYRSIAFAWLIWEIELVIEEMWDNG